MKTPSVLFATVLLTATACDKKDAPTEVPDAEQPAAEEAEDAEEPDDEMSSDTIVDIAVADGNFGTLVTALQATGLDSALAGDGPFTVFAPTDEAFAKLPEGTVEGLLQDKDKLAAILRYHVVSGKVMAAEVTALSEAESLSGKMLAIDASNGVKIGTATVVKADIEASNGVIHVIDTVLIPPAG